MSSRAAATQVDNDLEARIASFHGDEERVEVLKRARRFKASWVELGEALSRVMKEERWRGWGFPSFEEYCRKELHIKRDTAFKLTGSYSFLAARAPEVLRRDGLAAPIPPLESVLIWKRAEEEEAPRPALREIRQAVVDEAAPAAALKRRYREVLFPVGSDAAEEEEGRERAVLLGAARRLRQLLGDAPNVPRQLAADLEESLARLIDTLTS